MKASRKTLLALVGAVAVGAAVAAPSVEITSVQQQYPWTNTVDIVYTVAGVDSETNGYFVVFTPTTSTGVAIPDVNGETSVQVALKGSGVYSTQWFPQTNLQYTACKMTPSVFRGAAKDYMIVDLLTGAVTYEPMATQADSNKRYNTQEYKTTKMVLRKIEAGTYDVLDGTKKAYMEKDYYIAIFELTVAQYNIIMESGAATSTMPQMGISWNTFRDNALSTARVPDSGKGPLAKLNAKVHRAGNAACYFDLPNQAMWEVAARANCPANWCRYWGTTSPSDSTGLKEYTWWGQGVHAVGQKPANAWGLYDVMGNLWEWCRDSITYRTQSASANYSDNMNFNQTPTSTGSCAAKRGGRTGTSTEWVRLSSSPQVHYKTENNQENGFRIAMIVE